MPYCDKKVISFLLTSRCNMACKYCYGSRKAERRTLNINFAKCAIDEYIASNKINRIRFFADGEPTTEMALLQEIYSYACFCNPNIYCEIQTNGFFSIKTASWLADHMDEIWISMDLLPSAHDLFRVTKTGKPTSHVIEQNLLFFRNLPSKRAMIGIRGAITPYNIDHQKEGIDYLHSLGIDYIWVDPLFALVSDADEKFFEPIDLMHFAKTFIDAREHAKQIDVFYESNFTTNFDDRTHYSCRACLPMPHLTTDGYVSACEMCTGNFDAKHMDIFLYGRYDAENNTILYDQNKINVLRARELKNMPDCQDCIAKEHCAGFCLGETQNEMHDLFKIKKSVCEPIRYLYAHIGDDYQQFNGEFPYKHP